MDVLCDESRNKPKRIPAPLWSSQIGVPRELFLKAWEANPPELVLNPGQPLDSASSRRAAHRPSCAHVTESARRAISRSRPTRPACRDQSYHVDRQLTEATSSCSAVQVERSSTRLLDIESSSNVPVGVFRLKADTSAKRATGTGGTNMLMGFEQETAGPAAAHSRDTWNRPRFAE